ASATCNGWSSGRMRAPMPSRMRTVREAMYAAARNGEAKKLRPSWSGWKWRSRSQSEWYPSSSARSAWLSRSSCEESAAPVRYKPTFTSVAPVQLALEDVDLQRLHFLDEGGEVVGHRVEELVALVGRRRRGSRAVEAHRPH